ncbi:23S rRNA methyltransferase, partial [Blastococcus sp. KM273128]|nr:23S rRNA methyltransferase [Blastococcus sp. KM273128]
MLACPVCTAPFAVERDGAGLRCAAGHAVDRARQGHLTLLPPGRRPPAGDSAAMVADRVAFLSAGHYDGVTTALATAVLPGEPATLLDLGGGTGHHLARLLDELPRATGVVLDASRYAARRA